MSHETSKAMRRRWAEHDSGGYPWRQLFFRRRILDVGSGTDGLTIPSEDVTLFDAPDNAGDNIVALLPHPIQWFDVIHGSQVLEHMNDPVSALRSWLSILESGGHIVATTPDFVRYEKLCWPSKWNAGHKSTWSLDWPDSPAPIHCKLPEWLEQFEGTEIVLCRLVDSNFDYKLSPDIDQTFDPAKQVECFCEFVLRQL